MKAKFPLLSLVFLLCPIHSWAQNADNATPAFGNNSASSGIKGKFTYYLTETFLNPSAFTGPAFRAGVRVANPPGAGATRYPPEWRRGAEAFGRNYGDAFTQRATFQTARFATGVITREDPRYHPSISHNFFSRSFHAIGYTFVDRSDSGHAMPAMSNFVGAAAAGSIGNAYLPAGYDNLTHAGQRATLQFGFTAAGNLFREFAPQIPTPFVKRPFHLALYRSGPYAEERSRFLAHLTQKGRCFERLQRFNWYLLEVARQLDLNDDRRYTRRALMTIAVRWQRNRYPRSQSKRQSRIVILDFVFVASGWLRFLGRFEEEKEDLPYAQFLGDFFAFLRAAVRSAAVPDFVAGAREGRADPGHPREDCGWVVDTGSRAAHGRGKQEQRKCVGLSVLG